MDMPEVFPLDPEKLNELERQELDELMDSIIEDNLEAFQKLAK